MRVVIAEDQTMLRAGLVSLLEASGHEVVAEAGDEASLRAILTGWDADVAIVDVRLPPTGPCWTRPSSTSCSPDPRSTP